MHEELTSYQWKNYAKSSLNWILNNVNILTKKDFELLISVGIKLMGNFKLGIITASTCEILQMWWILNSSRENRDTTLPGELNALPFIDVLLSRSWSSRSLRAA